MHTSLEPSKLWLKARLNLENRPIWFGSGVPLTKADAAAFQYPWLNAQCSLYTEIDCAPLARMPPGHVAASISVSCLRLDVELEPSMAQLGQVLESQALLDDSRPLEERIPEVAETLHRWEQDGTVDFLKSCYQLLYHAFSNALEWIRDEYLQYWLPSLPPYIDEDQTTGRMGNFFDLVQASWSLDGSSWNLFRFPIIEARASVANPSELLSGVDWQRLGAEVGQETDLTLHLMARARAAFWTRDYRGAVITSTTAIEAEVSRFVRSRMHSRGLNVTEKQYRELGREAGIKVLLETLVTLLGEADSIDGLKPAVKSVLKANQLRNSLVHGSRRDVSRSEAAGAMNACGTLIGLLLPEGIKLRDSGWIPWQS